MESSMQKDKRATVVVDFYSDRELGWLKKEAEEGEKVYIELRKLLMIRDSPLPKNEATNLVRR